MKYIISDTHFGHKALLHLGTYSRLEGYEKILMKNLRRLKKTDTLYHLGDICIGRDAEQHKQYIEPLVCRKVLILGNHDSKTKTWYLTHGRDEVHDILLLTFDLGNYDNRGQGILRGKNILLTHQPIIFPPEGRYNIHGHLHDRAVAPYSNYHRLYSPERERYTPKEITKFF